MSNVDWARLQEISAEADLLIESGTWTRAEYNRLHAAAVSAAAGQGELLEFLVNREPAD